MAFRKAKKLADRELNSSLKVWLQAEYVNDYPTDVVAMKTFASLGTGVTTAHFYRHQRGHPKPHQPPYDVAILMVSQGLAFVRWLVTIDQKKLLSESATGEAKE